MALSRANFLVRFPEFTDTATAILDAALAEAVDQVNQTVWGSRWDAGVGYYAAHLLAISPRGETMRLSDAKTMDTYELHFKRLQSMVTVGLRNA